MARRIRFWFAELWLRTSELSSYQYGRAGFFSAVAIVLASVIGVALGEAGFVIERLSFLVQDPSNGFFDSSLNLILSTISLVFVVVIFLVQNANQEYSSRLSGVILHDRYFLAIIGFILTASIFSVSGSYFDLGTPFTVIGYAFSVAVVLLVGSLIAFAGYFISIANIIEYTTRDIEKSIATERIYRPNRFGVPLQDEDYIGRLASDTQLIVSTCIEAIEENQRPVVDSCLNSLERIANKYLDQTTEREVSEDFLQELNDQFQFIGSTAFDDYSRQKYSESVVETVGNIGVAITKNRELGAQASMWANLLKKLFRDSLEFDRTTAASISIQKLGEMSVTAIKKGDTDSVRVFQGELETIAAICSSRNHSYLASLLQTLHLQYQKMYVSYLATLLNAGYAPEYDVSSLLETFADSFNQAKSNYGHMNKQVVYAGPFGLSSFAGRIAHSLLENQDPDPRTQHALSEFLSQTVDFLRDISLTNSEENHQDIYKGYTQFLFIFETAVPVDDELKIDLISELNDAWIELIGTAYKDALETSESVDHRLNERISDFIAFLIYFHRDDPEVLAELIEQYPELYRELSDEYPGSENHVENNLKRLYKQLKLAGAWVNRFHDPESTTPELWSVLVEDFYEIPESRSRIPRPLMAEYGYPTGTRTHTRDNWWLRPDNLWSYTGFQDTITASLNGEDGSNYVELHERLEAA
ncbi:hypothetical protein ACFQO4_03105 [Saliphagus sp. GCM10025334]